MKPVSRVVVRLALIIAVLAAGMVTASSAQADRSFSVRYSTNDTGSIKGIANTNMTCPSSNSSCKTAQDQNPTSSSNTYYNNNYDMTYVDVDSDSSTFNSSTANQSLPAGSSILFAGLYWGGDYSTGTAAAPNSSARNIVKLKLPGSSSYTNITANTLDDSTLNVGRYQAFADITAQVQALPNAGNGTYAVANIQAGKGSDHYAGWTLIVAYRNTAESAKNMSIFDGLVTIRSSDPPTTIPFSGFLTPPTGAVNPQIGFVTWEGDHGLVGDTASLNGNTLSDAQHPATNFFNSRISHNGVLYTDRNPDYANALGIDAAWTTPPAGTVGNSQTSATLRVTTSGDQYLPGVITFQTEIFAPKIEQNKSVTDDNGGVVEQGDTLTYKISGKNNGLDGTSNFVLRDPIPPNTTYVPGSIVITKNTNATTGARTDASADDIAEYDSANARIVARLGEGATTSLGGNVKPGSEYEVTFKVKVNGPTPNPVTDGTVLTNTATASYLSQTTATPLNSVSTATSTVKSPDLRIVKVRSGAAFVAGGSSAYTFTVDNHGNAKSQGTVTVSDPIPAGLTVTAISAPGWTCNSVPAASLTCSRSDSLAAGSSYPAIVATVAIDQGVTGEVENTSTVSGGGDANLSDNTSSSTNPTTNLADLELTKTASKHSVVLGENFSYDLKVTNHGPSKATSVAITDDLPAGLSFVSATPAPGCAIQPPSGVLGCAIGTLNSGQSHTVTITVHVDNDAHGTVTNSATVGAQQTDPNLTNNTGIDEVEVGSADLKVTKVKKSPANVFTGSNVVYEVKVQNLGPSNATGVVLTDVLPAGLNSVTTNKPVCSVASPNVNCLVGNLASGSSFTVEISGTVAAGTSQLINRAAATGNEHDPDTSNNSDQVETPVSPVADLAIQKLASVTAIVPGEEFTYTFKVTNHGPDNVTGITVTDTLPAGITYVDGAPGCNAVGQVVTCTINFLAAGGTGQTGISVVANGSAANPVSNTAKVGSNVHDPDPNNNTSTIETPVNKNADVQIVKTVDNANPQVGDEITYTLTVKNNGPGKATGVVATDDLPDGVTFVSADAPCTESGGTVSCSLGDLNPGQQVAVKIKVKVNSWNTVPSTGYHGIDVEKVETQIDLNPGETKIIQATCPVGFFVSDGSVRIDHVDQGTGDWTAPQVLESRAIDSRTWQGTVTNTATGRVQAKIFAVCIRETTSPDTTGHSLQVSAPVAKTVDLVDGANEAVLECPSGTTAIQPGFIADVPGLLVYSQPEGNGWKFVYKTDGTASGDQAVFSIRCLSKALITADGHSHDLSFKRIWTEQTIQPGKVNEVQLICPDGSKGIVGGWDLDDGLVSLGNDPRPVTRAFKVYNPTDHPLTVRYSLLCLGDHTSGVNTGDGSRDIINTADVDSSSNDTDPLNNESSVTVHATPANDDDPVVVGPGKPPVNNPIATTIVGKGVSYSASGVTFTLKCSGACGGTAKLTTLKKVKAGGKKYGKGTVLASKQYFIGTAGTKKVKLKLTRAGKKILKTGKVSKASLKISGGTRKVVKVGRR